MRKFFLTMAVMMTASLSAYALPSLVPQNSISFSTDIHDRGLVTLYPGGGGTFAVPNYGNSVGTDVRLSLISSGSVYGIYGTITYCAPGQLNVYADSNFGAPGFFPVFLFGTNVTVRLERLISGVWTAQSTDTVISISNGKPNTAVNGSNQINADLYCSVDGSYIKNTLSGNNPRTCTRGGVTGRTVLAFYVTGAYVPNVGGGHVICNVNVKIGGVVRNGYIGTSYPYYIGGAYQGLQQINIAVPSTAMGDPINTTASTTWQFSGVIGFSCPISDNYGNTATIPNWI